MVWSKPMKRKAKSAKRGYRVYQRYLESMEKNIKRNCFSTNLLLTALFHSDCTFSPTRVAHLAKPSVPWKRQSPKTSCHWFMTKFAGLSATNTLKLSSSLEALKEFIKFSDQLHAGISSPWNQSYYSGAFVGRVYRRIKLIISMKCWEVIILNNKCIFSTSSKLISAPVC